LWLFGLQVRVALVASRIIFFMHKLTPSTVLSLRLFYYWLPPLLWMAIIFWFSTDRFASGQTETSFGTWVEWLAPWTEYDERVRLHILFRKLGHLTEYAILAILWKRAFDSRQWRARFLARPLLRACSVGLLVFGYAIIDEWHQTFTANRTGALTDCLIDLAGGIFGLVLHHLVTGWKVFHSRQLTGPELSANFKSEDGA
ncbi:MAG: hypothetical protein EBU88_06905, partial [Acidobacteria bacterium]|nr:hypothetical protein [Acidobacteriota bacterium]